MQNHTNTESLRPKSPAEAIEAVRRKFQAEPEPPNIIPAAEPSALSPREQVLLDAGLPASINLGIVGCADITAITAGLLDKTQIAALRVLEAQAAVFVDALEAAGAMENNPFRLGVALVEQQGRPVNKEELDFCSEARSRRGVAIKIAKHGCRWFWRTQVVPGLAVVDDIVSTHLKKVILDRLAAERAAFGKMKDEFYQNNDDFNYQPSPGVLGLVSRRIQLLSPRIAGGIYKPSAHLAGIINFS